MTDPTAAPEERTKLFLPPAAPIDFGLGSEAEAIQSSLIRVWGFDSRVRPWALLALSWGYQDCRNYYADADAKFLWELSMEMWNK